MRNMISFFFLVSILFSCIDSPQKKEVSEKEDLFPADRDTSFVLLKSGELFGVWNVLAESWFIEPIFLGEWFDLDEKILTQNGIVWFFPVRSEDEIPDYQIWWFGNDGKIFQIYLPYDNPHGNSLADEFKNYGYILNNSTVVVGLSEYLYDISNFDWIKK